MIWLLTALGWLKKAASALWGIITRHPWQAALCASLLANVWLWRGWNGAEQDLADRIAAEERAEAAQTATNKEHVRKSQEVADHAEVTHSVQRDRNRAAARQWSDAHRLPAKGSAGKGDLTAKNQTAAVPADTTPSPTLVAVPESDMMKFADLMSYAEACHVTALGLVGKGVAEWSDVLPGLPEKNPADGALVDPKPSR